MWTKAISVLVAEVRGGGWRRLRSQAPRRPHRAHPSDRHLSLRIAPCAAIDYWPPQQPHQCTQPRPLNSHPQTGETQKHTMERSGMFTVPISLSFLTHALNINALKLRYIHYFQQIHPHPFCTRDEACYTLQLILSDTDKRLTVFFPKKSLLHLGCSPCHGTKTEVFFCWGVRSILSENDDVTEKWWDFCWSCIINHGGFSKTNIWL